MEQHRTDTHVLHKAARAYQRVIHFSKRNESNVFCEQTNRRSGSDSLHVFKIFDYDLSDYKICRNSWIQLDEHDANDFWTQSADPLLLICMDLGSGEFDRTMERDLQNVPVQHHKRSLCDDERFDCCWTYFCHDEWILEEQRICRNYVLVCVGQFYSASGLQPQHGSEG